MTGLAARLGMRRSPSRLDATGTLRLPPRVVSPQPPHHPEPLPDEPFAPVYDFRPMRDGELARAVLPMPPPGPVMPLREPDELVFGPPGSGELQVPPDPALVCEPIRRCATCGVQWRGSEPCWSCPAPATEI